MFDKTSGAFRHKTETTVHLQLTGQTPMEASIFCVNGERLSDVLNDLRAFIPVRSATGEIIIVAKTQIACIIERENSQQEKIADEPAKRAAKAFDPYLTLRISPDASHDEIRAAYRARIKSVHPDTIASLGLDEDLSKAASHATHKIIRAYRKIMRERKLSDDVAPDETA